MQKFKNGDLIIKDSKFYCARLVGEKETLFDEIELFGFGEGDSGISGFRTFGPARTLLISNSPEDCSTGRCQPQQFNPQTGRIEPQVNEGTYPIMGNVDLTKIGCAPLINMWSLARYYPELTMRYAAAVIRHCNARMAVAAGGQHMLQNMFKTPGVTAITTSSEPIKKSPRKKAAPKKVVKKVVKRRV